MHYMDGLILVLMFITFIKRVGKSCNMRGLSSIILLFGNEFNKFNYASARMLDYIYHMTLKRTSRNRIIL